MTTIEKNEQKNKEIVSRWFDEFWGSSCNAEIVDALAAPDILLQYSVSNIRFGRCAVKQFMRKFRKAFSDLNFKIIGDIIADRDLVVVRWSGKGTHTGPAFDDFNIGPLPTASGVRIVLSGHTAVRLHNGLIFEEAIWSEDRKTTLRCVAGGSH